MSGVEYEAPKVLRFVGSVLAFLRSEYSTDFGNFITASSGSIEHSRYRSGITFVVCLVSSVLFLWGFILLWLKLNSKYVGCAAGKPFRKRIIKRRDRHGTPIISNLTKTTARQPERHYPSVPPQSSYRTRRGELQPDTLDDIPTSSDPEDLIEIISVLSASQPSITSPHTSIEQQMIVSGRERRTQICFVMFGCIAVACLPSILALCVRPLVAASVDLSFETAEAQAILSSARTALSAINQSYTDTIANKTSSLTEDLREHCPNFAQVRAIYGIDLDVIFNVVSPEAAEVDAGVSTLVRNLSDVLPRYTSVVNSAFGYSSLMDRLLWLPPVMLFSITLSVVFVIIGVYYAWDRQASIRYQNVLSYGVLPFLALGTLACWAFLLGSVATTSVMNDLCLSDDSPGTPEDTVKDILNEAYLRSGNAMYDYTTAIVSGCQSSNPSTEIDNLARRTEAVVDVVRSALLLIDSVGREEIASVCDNKISGENYFIAYLPPLAVHYSTVQTNLDVVSRSLSCEDMHQLFTNVVNESICTTVAGASSWAILLFLVLGISTMTLISLRAAWRHHAIVDKIYDESEVAENMILDEHEEYLVYISKFRHEWQEYQGVDAGLREIDLQKEAVGESSSANSAKLDQHRPKDLMEDLGTPAHSVVSEDRSQLDSVFDPYTSDSRSMSPSADSISFLSLKEGSSTVSPRQGVTSLPSLLATNHGGSGIGGAPPLLFAPSLTSVSDTRQHDHETTT